MNILFVADPLESFKIYKDTTFSMMREAQRRGHTVAACEPQHIVWQRGGVGRNHIHLVIPVTDTHTIINLTCMKAHQPM